MWIITTDNQLANVHDARKIYAEYEENGDVTIAHIVAAYPNNEVMTLAVVRGGKEVRGNVESCMQAILNPAQHSEGVCNLRLILNIEPEFRARSPLMAQSSR